MTTPPPGLSLAQLHYLVAVADAPTWAVAARRLGISPSALSQALGEMERRLGIDLFERRGRRRVPHPAAAPVFEFAVRVLAESRDLRRWLDEVARGDRGQLRVGMIDSAAVDHFPLVLRAFRDARPELDVHLAVAPSVDLIDRVIEGGLDLVVCVAPQTPPAGIDLVPLLDEPLRLYAPPGITVGRPASWGPFVTFPPGSHTRRIVTDALVALGATVEVVAESHQPEVLGSMVRVGLGWAVLPQAQAERGPEPLVPATPAPVATRTLVLARRSHATAHPAADALAEELRGGVATTLERKTPSARRC